VVEDWDIHSDDQVSTDYRVDTLKFGEAQPEELTGRAGFWSGA
jgi:hypothetical protein